ncbi:hypothetical protein CK203_105107 [Vitis vinifera]|uniref:Integrase catalytic domain-containing protein n=1 Tax=Vitis vinifera TaxID=29760 RepID=A0A438CNP2_VITVI|nr:hypothetical protein CK203_105107 [Vitis vinifera]
MCKPTLLSQKPPLATPLRQAKDDQEWTNNITEYLRTGTCPKIPSSTQGPGASCPFHLIGGTCTSALHRTLLRCLSHSEALYVLAECTRGMWKSFWRTHAPIPHMPSETLKPISGPWPFAQWGMDIVGPLPAHLPRRNFCSSPRIYFSKWVEAEAYASIKDKDVTKFVWKNIICRFGIQTIIADNGPQFDSIAFRNFCSELNIRNSYSTPRYPQSNGQAEATNKTLITALKKRLEQAKGKWVEELPGVLWAYRTTPGGQQETLPSPSHTVWTQSFLPK